MAERHTECISMRRWQLLKRGQARYAELLGGGKGELSFGLVPDGAKHLKSCSRIHCVIQQGRLANSRLPTNDDRAAVTRSRRAQHVVEYLALASSPEQGCRSLL
jgi:hypothetical protein